MRISLWIIWFLLLAGCGSTSDSLDLRRNLNHKTIALKADTVEFVVDTPHLDQQSVTRLKNGMVDSLSKNILQDMIIGFELERKRGIEYVSDYSQADLQLELDSIWVSRGRFTLDFTHPGPIFTIQLQMRGFDNQNFVYLKRFKGNANLSQVVGKERSFYWPNQKDKANSDNQIQTVLSGLRPVMGEGFADFLKIDQYQ